VGGLTSLFGALAADRCRRFFGWGGSMVLGLALGGAGVLLVAAAPHASLFAAALLIAQQVISDPGWTVYEINQMSLRQAIAPEGLLGRVNAGIRFAGLLAVLAGSLFAAILAEAAGARLVLVFGAGAVLAGALLLFLSPVRRIRAGKAMGEGAVLSAAAS
jgi:hypothetical protein